MLLAISVIVFSLIGTGCHPSIVAQENTSNPNRIEATAGEQATPTPGIHSEEDDGNIEESVLEEATEYCPPEPLEAPLPALSEIAEGCKKFEIPFVEFTIREDGMTEDHRYIRGTECESADRILLEYVRRWTFKPATVNGAPISEEYTTAIHW